MLQIRAAVAAAKMRKFHHTRTKTFFHNQKDLRTLWAYIHKSSLLKSPRRTTMAHSFQNNVQVLLWSLVTFILPTVVVFWSLHNQWEILVMCRTPFYRTLNGLEHQFSNIERTQTCSSFESRTSNRYRTNIEHFSLLEKINLSIFC